MTIISLLLLVSLLPHLTFTAHVNVGIVNGRWATHRPYMVSIQLNKRHICGGFLIYDQWVLTAAHCLDRKSLCQSLMIVVGVLDLTESNNLDRIKVKYCFQHQQSTTRPYRNDIMLLMLYEKINPNKHHFNLIHLPNEGDDGTANRFCSVMGWGLTEPNGNLSARLLEANAFIENRQKCEGIWKFEYIDSQMICVSGKGGSCKYDSGGPLVCGNIAVGITSFGSLRLCDADKKPTVYTKISFFLPWIKQTIRNVK